MSNQYEAIVGSDQPLALGIILYPFMTALDFVGPLTALSMSCTTYLLSKTLDPVATDTGFSVVPTMTYADCPQHLDILLVPGGFGSNAAMQDPELINFLKSRGATADYVTSVCSGSTVLGAAGLLKDYKSTTHWAYFPVLKAMGIETASERVVTDRNRISGGGVTAGIDFGLSVLAKVRGEDVAKRMQLIMEYDPQPPFQAGHPNSTEPRLTEQVTQWINPLIQEAVTIAEGIQR